jgi:hypothetical protein
MRTKRKHERTAPPPSVWDAPMSYSLHLRFKPRARREHLLQYFAARRHYKRAKNRVSYANEDTGVYFWFDLRCSRDILLRRTVVSAEFEINYNRPSFFATEAEKELSAFVARFQPRIEDPQMRGMGEGPYSAEGFFNGWNFGNAFSIRSVLARSPDAEVLSMPSDALRAAWEWNNRLAERRDRHNRANYVPIILFWRVDGRASRVVVWSEARPILLPRVDYVVVARDTSDKPQVGLAAWDEVVEVAKRAGFDTGKQPLELRYLVPPPAIADWAANLPLIDLKSYARLHPYQILDEELIAAARDDSGAE